MPEVQESGRAGGAGNEAGGDFRARVAAWTVTHALVGRSIEALELPAGFDVPTGHLLPESTAAVDDLEIHLTQGARLYVQAKRSLSLSDSPDSVFASVAQQLCKQVATQPFDSRTTRLAIVVGQQSGPLRALQRVLSRGRRPLAAPPTEQESKSRDILLGHLGGLTEPQRQSLLNATVVLLPDLDTPESPNREQCIAWLNLIVEVGAGHIALKHLEAEARQLSTKRFGIDMDGWLDALARGGVKLRPDCDTLPGPARAATLLALDQYRAWTLARGRQPSLRALCERVPDIEIRPDTRDVLVQSENAEITLSWAVRRRRRLLLLGLPGVGKSTALRRLAAENAAQSVAPLPIYVSLPAFAEAYRTERNSVETFVDVAIASAPDYNRSLLRRELLMQLRTGGRAILLLDALDECRSRRHAVVEAIHHALVEIHEDVETVLATRDVGYAHAAVLGFHEAVLIPPLDLFSVLWKLARYLAEAQNVPSTSCEKWAEDILDSVRPYRAGGGEYHKTPIAATAMVVLASQDRLTAPSRGYAAAQSALVDWLARRWEFDERRRGELTLSAGITEAESAQLLIEVFDTIAHIVDARGSLLQHELREEVAAWVQENWQLAPGRARVAASAAIEFWDEAGVFVCEGAEARVRARHASLLEVGVARWLAHRATSAVRSAWIRSHFRDDEQQETVVLLAALHRPSLETLIDLAYEYKSRTLLLLLARVFEEGPRRTDDSDWKASLRRVVAALLPYLADGGRHGWEVLTSLVRLPLDEDDAHKVLSIVRVAFEGQRADIASAVAVLRWRISGELNRAQMLATLTAGQPVRWPPTERMSTRAARLEAIATEPLYNVLACELAATTEPTETELVRVLVAGVSISIATHDEVTRILRRRGLGDLVSQLYDKDSKFQTLASDSLRSSEDSHQKLMEIVGGLGTPAASYQQLRRMDELVDYFETAIPSDTIAAAFEGVMQHQLDLARVALRAVAELGGFDTSVLAAQVGALSADGVERHFRLRAGATPRTLSRWPTQEAADRMLCSMAILFTGTTWTGDVASRALQHCPHPELAVGLLDLLLPRVRHWLVRGQIAWTLLELDAEHLKRARDWLQSADPILVRAGALAVAHIYLSGEASAEVLEEPLLLSDGATRAEVRRILEASPRSSEIAELLSRSRALLQQGWACLRCRRHNDPKHTACSECNLVR